MRGWRKYLCLPLLLWCGACAMFKPADHFGSYPVTYNQLTGWASDSHSQALQTFLASCPVLAQRPRPANAGSGLQVPGSVWQSLCNEASHVQPGNNEQAQQFFERRFVPYRITNNGKEKGLFTGYYVPTLYGSHKKKGDYAYPLYVAPPDLGKRKPYYNHAEINNGALANRGLELVWVDDPVMRFFLHIQGSGRVRMNDGREMLVGYAGQNGYKYESLGKIMGDENLIAKDQINFYTIRRWLYDHPGQAFPMMERNPSYVFFKRLEVSGVVGAVGVVLTKQRSMAVDSNYIPYGLPLFLETELPFMQCCDSVPFKRLMIAQDTGGAIKGPVRGDIFFGEGSEAEFLAGYMKGRGTYSLLVPKEIADQLPK